jgi:hypothetical protein
MLRSNWFKISTAAQKINIDNQARFPYPGEYWFH